MVLLTKHSRFIDFVVTINFANDEDGSRLRMNSKLKSATATAFRNSTSDQSCRRKGRDAVALA